MTFPKQNTTVADLQNAMAMLSIRYDAIREQQGLPPTYGNHVFTVDELARGHQCVPCSYYGDNSELIFRCES